MENKNIVDRGLMFQERFKELVGNSTQEEVAKKVNTSRQNVGNWLKGKSRPDIYALAEISKGFNVSTDYLLGLTDVKSTDTTLQGVCEYTGLSDISVERVRHICKEDGRFKSKNRRALNAILKNINSLLLWDFDNFAFLKIRLYIFEMEILKKYIKDNYPEISQKEVVDRGIHIFNPKATKEALKFGKSPYIVKRDFEEFLKQKRIDLSILDTGLSVDIGYERYKFENSLANAFDDLVFWYLDFDKEYDEIKEYYEYAINECKNEKELKEYVLEHFDLLRNIIDPDYSH